MSLEIDLSQFCGDDRSFFTRPFSVGGYTYATNGHVLVRVPSIESIEPPENAPENFEAKINEILAGIEDATYFELPIDEIPPKPDDVDCWACDGRGHKHNCPNCQCACEQCLGKGHVAPNDIILINRRPFNGHYTRMIASLPKPRMAIPPRTKRGHDSAPAFFRFGDVEFGAVMGLAGHGPGKHPHIKLGDRSK